MMEYACLFLRACTRYAAEQHIIASLCDVSSLGLRLISHICGRVPLTWTGGILLIYWGCEYFFSRPFSIRVFPLTLASNLKKYADVGKAGEETK
jgi:hypothetical protein